MRVGVNPVRREFATLLRSLGFFATIQSTCHLPGQQQTFPCSEPFIVDRMILFRNFLPGFDIVHIVFTAPYSISKLLLCQVFPLPDRFYSFTDTILYSPVPSLSQASLIPKALQISCIVSDESPLLPVSTLEMKPVVLFILLANFSCVSPK